MAFTLPGPLGLSDLRQFICCPRGDFSIGNKDRDLVLSLYLVGTTYSFVRPLTQRISRLGRTQRFLKKIVFPLVIGFLLFLKMQNQFFPEQFAFQPLSRGWRDLFTPFVGSPERGAEQDNEASEESTEGRCPLPKHGGGGAEDIPPLSAGP